MQRRHWLLPVVAAIHLQALIGLNWILSEQPQPLKETVVFTLIAGLNERHTLQSPPEPDDAALPEPRIFETFVPEHIPPPANLPMASFLDEPAPSTAITARTAAAGSRAPAEPARAIEGSVREDFISLLAAHLARHKQYPVDARRRRVHGVVTVQFRVHADGMVDECSIIDSSGNRLLDAAALAMLRRAQPLPRIPPELALDSLRINLPVEFSLTHG